MIPCVSFYVNITRARVFEFLIKNHEMPTSVRLQQQEYLSLSDSYLYNIQRLLQINGGALMQQWWLRIRFTVKSILFPIICLQFIRTLLFPNPLDVFILFLFFMAYLGFLFNYY